MIEDVQNENTVREATKAFKQAKPGLGTGDTMELSRWTL